MATAPQAAALETPAAHKKYGFIYKARKGAYAYTVEIRDGFDLSRSALLASIPVLSKSAARIAVKAAGATLWNA